MNTILLVFPSDSGHFNLSKPLACRLTASGYNVEYWCSRDAVSWVSIPEQVKGTMGNVPRELLDWYIKLVSVGDSDDEGLAQFNRAFITQEVPIPSDLFAQVSPSSQEVDAFKKRLTKGDVKHIVMENCWCADSVVPLIADTNIPYTKIAPSFLVPFRGDSLPKNVHYSLAKCLRRDVLVTQNGCSVVGAFLPIGASSEQSETQEIQWINQDLSKKVIYCSLGSHMLAQTLATDSVQNIINGTLATGHRLLMVLKKGTEDGLDLSNENIMVSSWVNQPAVLSHPSVVGFISHCGANSIHESLMGGHTPIVGIPFFDDQFYNIQALVSEGVGVRISKLPNIKTQVITDAINKLVGKVDDKLEQLQKEIIEDDGIVALLERIKDSL